MSIRQNLEQLPFSLVGTLEGKHKPDQTLRYSTPSSAVAVNYLAVCMTSNCLNSGQITHSILQSLHLEQVNNLEQPVQYLKHQATTAYFYFIITFYYSSLRRCNFIPSPIPSLIFFFKYSS